MEIELSLTQHPLSAAFPSMADADYQALKDDIEDHGQREPIIVFEGMVLDGWHRYRACRDLGIKPTQFNFGDEDPVKFVLSHNLHRRHLTETQRALAVIACQNWAPPHRLKNKQAHVPASVKTNAQMATEAGVSERTIKNAKVAHEAGLTDALRDGTMSARAGAALVLGTPVKKPSKPKPQAPPPDTGALDDAQEAVSVLSEENDRLNDRLAVAAMEATPEERTAATETIAELRAKIAVLEASLRAVTASRDGYMRENAEMKSQLASYRRKLDKLQATPSASNDGSLRGNHAATRRPN